MGQGVRRLQQRAQEAPQRNKSDLSCYVCDKISDVLAQTFSNAVSNATAYAIKVSTADSPESRVTNLTNPKANSHLQRLNMINKQTDRFPGSAEDCGLTSQHSSDARPQPWVPSFRASATFAPALEGVSRALSTPSPVA